MASIYALLDEESLQLQEWSIERFIRRAKDVDAKILQYRNKIEPIKTIRKKLKKIRDLYSGIVIINDYPELVYLCHGVHVGQEDLKDYEDDPKEAIYEIRRMTNFFGWIGLSTHNLEEIEVANSLPIDYIGLGAYRNTNTKSDAKVLGDELSKLAKLSHHPVAAIGGVRLDDKIDNVTYLVVGSGMYEDGGLRIED